MMISKLPDRVKYNRVSPVINARIRQAFAGYVALYHKGNKEYDSHIGLKEEHTGRVCAEIRLIGQSLKMNEEELAFAEVLAWLHDIGRFEQFDRYATFADAESENHALIALRVIEKLDLLKDFDPDQQHIIRQAILNHNLPRLPDIESSAVEFYSRLLRDADKLDIWRVSLEYTIFHRIRNESFPDSYTVPEKLSGCFKENRIILLDQVETFYDSLLFRMSWIYDLSFPHAFKMVREREIIRKLAAKIPSSQELKEIVERAERFVSVHSE